ncbi:MAG: fimbrillin family protein, partial [Duncaniella sp.]|nr:fimbrillin family protein [Duncaniella sp.]
MKKIYLLAAFTLALTACDSNDDNTSASSSSEVPARVTATIAESVASRAAGTQWAKDDKIGITINVMGEDENDETLYPTGYTNVCYTTEGDGEFKGTPLFFYWPMVVPAYYPYSDAQEVVPGNSGKLTA